MDGNDDDDEEEDVAFFLVRKDRNGFMFQAVYGFMIDFLF